MVGRGRTTLSEAARRKPGGLAGTRAAPAGGDRGRLVGAGRTGGGRRRGEIARALDTACPPEQQGD